MNTTTKDVMLDTGEQSGEPNRSDLRIADTPNSGGEAVLSFNDFLGIIYLCFGCPFQYDRHSVPMLVHNIICAFDDETPQPRSLNELKVWTSRIYHDCASSKLIEAVGHLWAGYFSACEYLKDAAIRRRLSSATQSTNGGTPALGQCGAVPF
jgi:hypothetical protein